MKNKVWFTLNLILMLAIIGLQSVKAQNPSGEFAVASTFSLANCETGAVAGFTMFCPTGTGQVYYCLSNCSSAAGWVLVGGATGVQKVQGTSPGATGNVSLTCTVPFPATMATFTAGTSTSAQFAASNILANCVGQGN